MTGTPKHAVTLSDLCPTGRVPLSSLPGRSLGSSFALQLGSSVPGNHEEMFHL